MESLLVREGITAHFFDPSALSILVSPVSSTGREVRRLRPDVAFAQGARAILDGSMYEDIGGGIARPRFLMYDNARGIAFRSEQPRDGMTISVVGNTASARSGDRMDDRASVAVQLYPELIREGRDRTNPARDTERVWRAGLGIHQDGRLGFAVGIGSMTTFARRMRDLGFLEAGYTDGGDSTYLQAIDGSWAGTRRLEPVASWLMDMSGQGSSSGGNEWLTPVIIAGAAAWWLGMRK